VLGSGLPQQIAERMFSAFDTGKNGYLLYRDFICAMAIMAHGTPEEKSMLVFDIYDVEKSGFVDKKVRRKWCVGRDGECGRCNVWLIKEDGECGLIRKRWWLVGMSGDVICC
jgi:Ca2+-binding EF-hand superfamily protein